jgi:hypothetical protein
MANGTLPAYSRHSTAATASITGAATVQRPLHAWVGHHYQENRRHGRVADLKQSARNQP